MPRTIFREGVRGLLEEGAQLVDVLPPEEYGGSHLPGAVNIPLRELNRETAEQLRRDKPVIAYCHDHL